MASPAAYAHVEAQARIRRSTKDAVQRLWLELGSYNEADVERFVRQAGRIVDGGQRQAVAIANAFIAGRLGKRVKGLPVDSLIGKNARKAPKDDVYRRPFISLWGGLKEGKSFENAFAEATTLAGTLAATDVQLAARNGIRSAGRAYNAAGYERVPDGNACDLCLIASTQRYWIEDLMPIHSNCGCGVEPLSEETGQVINPDLLQTLNDRGAVQKITDQRIASRARAAAERGTEVAVHNSAELGPVLSNAAHNIARS